LERHRGSKSLDAKKGEKGSSVRPANEYRREHLPAISIERELDVSRDEEKNKNMLAAAHWSPHSFSARAEFLSSHRI